MGVYKGRTLLSSERLMYKLILILTFLKMDVGLEESKPIQITYNSQVFETQILCEKKLDERVKKIVKDGGVILNDIKTMPDLMHGGCKKEESNANS